MKSRTIEKELSRDGSKIFTIFALLALLAFAALKEANVFVIAMYREVFSAGRQTTDLNQ